MKSRRLNESDDGLTISRSNSRSLTSMSGRENSDPIPIDLIFEILLRLPAKSIARCRCVSKLWASTLRLPNFTELFLTRSSDRPQLLFSCQKNDDLLFFSAPQVHSSLVALTYHMKFSFVLKSEISGYVRGLVCVKHLRAKNATIPEICNPSTGQCLTLPKMKTRRVKVRSFFVYDLIGKQFKVLAMSWPCYNSGWTTSEHQILTLGSPKLSWRMIKCCITHQPSRDDGICISGCLYYEAIINGRSDIIICFDCSSEEFGYIRRAKDTGMFSESTLVNYNGKLGILLSNEFEVRRSRCIELSVLVDAEKHEWSNHRYTFPLLWQNLVYKSDVYFVGMNGTNEIVLAPRYLSGQFYVFYYNLERNTIIRVEIQGMEASKHGRVHTFLNHVEDVTLYANV